MRTGLVPDDGIGVVAAQALQSAGAQMLVVHGRSRRCRFKGQANYASVQEIAQGVSIPVLVNGDIDSAEAANRALKISGAHGVMIGRGALGRPWLFAEITQATRAE